MTRPFGYRLETAYQTALAALLAERTPEGHWVGELSTSALSTATAVGALALVQKATTVHGSFEALLAGGLSWLAANQNADGGWGDTVVSFSNISTTMLCRAAFHLAGAAASHEETFRRSEEWLHARYGKTPEELAEAVRARYGKDRTFSVPILMTSALAGLVSWREVPALPFELACFPQSWFRFLRIPVVSYALPALIAIGQAVYQHRPPRNPLTRLVRRGAIGKSLRVLQKIQPTSGGFLEATPLTSFVTMALASIGRAEHPVVSKCVEFLVASVRSDGSWPIDTNLATWVTTLSINALAAAGDLDKLDRKEQLSDWLLRQQYKERHPYTGADPGGWAWTDLPGGVPDADDTPGVLLALYHLDPTYVIAFRNGFLWLWGLQNRDGGIPTFCRGWGHLPFDRSGCDLTAHTLRALTPWYDRGKPPQEIIEIEDRLEMLHDGGLGYLARHQRPDGFWLPLWFGNQHAPNDENPVYGTSRVLAAYRDLAQMSDDYDCDLWTSEPALRGIAWLLSVQNADGGWGGAANTPSSIEETALAVEVLLDAEAQAETAVERGLCWLIERIEAGGLSQPTPIGFYFAKLWYFEKLYPIIFSVAALGRARRKLSSAH
ncbi:MAG TPA: prenyltransferase/squalene oxidase repeat-containing protein [Gemmataceae bacterium]|nr:prenyltransferase/squalene oxidase repeat-containing protein [Gemmataceae bacterium]